MNKPSSTSAGDVAAAAARLGRIAMWDVPALSKGSRDGLPLLDAALATAARAGAGLLVTPELALVTTLENDLDVAAEPSDGPLAQALAALCRAHATALVAGYLERCSGRLHSAAIVIDREGNGLANYRRVHDGTAEPPLAAVGQWLTVVPLGGRRIGLAIGADLHHPEHARALVLAGADLLVVLGGPDPASDVGREEGRALLAARQIENGLPAFAAWQLDAGSMADGTVRIADLDPADRAAPARARLLAARRPRLYRSLLAVDEP